MREPARRLLAATACAALLLGLLPAHAAIIVGSSDPRCISLPGPFPPGLDWIDATSALGLVANSENMAIVRPVDLGTTPPTPTAPGNLFDLRPAIASANGCSANRYPILDGVTVASPALALVTTSTCETVAFLDPLAGTLRNGTVSTPAGFAAGVFPLLPPPGTSATRAALSTRMCVALPPGTLDSKGVPVASDCGAGAPSFYTNFSSGAAVAAGRLFVTSSNLGAGAGTLAPQFLPGTVLVYELGDAPLAAAPHPTTPVLRTSAFNPTHATAYTTPHGRELVLVGASGALGLVSDDPGTPYREAGGVALSEAAIDVIDATQLRVVATIPLGLAALAFERLGIDPSGRVALIGSALARHVYAADLAPLDALAPDAPYLVLDGAEGRPAAAIFDAGHPLVLPGIANGAPPETCPGFVVGVEFGSTRDAYATDFCDGTITRIRIPTPAGPAPLARARFSVEETTKVAAPVGPASLGQAQALGALRVFTDPSSRTQAAILVGQPEGLVCRVEVPVPEPAPTALGAAASLALSTLAAHRARPRRQRRSQQQEEDPR
ncbi:MAG: hypothetical protein OZ928_07545 [Polyangiaceae bacterium]|nr:hypothetical protein [Polyangiaceae bacterium]